MQSQQDYDNDPVIKLSDIYGGNVANGSASQPCAVVLLRSRRAGDAKMNDLGYVHAILRYLPLAPRSEPDEQSVNAASLQVVRPSMYAFPDQICISNACKVVSWPKDELPLEIFEEIAKLLDHQDHQAMRLVNHEFEHKVSPFLFKTCVVPFNTEIYDLVKQHNEEPQAKRISGNASDGHDVHTEEQPSLTAGKKPALPMFELFGQHVRRFGISFELSEQHLRRAPKKVVLDTIDSYHGIYQWPNEKYSRFPGLAAVERIADEMPRMRTALATLKAVQELGLSLDSGLGWLSGPDVSLRAQICPRPSVMFAHAGQKQSRHEHELAQFWRALKASYGAFPNQHSIQENNLVFEALHESVENRPVLADTLYADDKLWQIVQGDRCAHELTSAVTTVLTLTRDKLSDGQNPIYHSTLLPNKLSRQQKEWLLETGWAQRAFLESYMLAMIDNVNICKQVTTLSVTKISSGLIPSLDRFDFWQALQSLSNLTLKVSADWREIERDDASRVLLTNKPPSAAVTLLFGIVDRRIAPKVTIKKLHIGFTDGGEHAEGLLARNKHVLPAPLTTAQGSIHASSSILTLPYVQDFTLSNCWICPQVLEKFVHRHGHLALRRLCLHSVSLARHPSANDTKFTMMRNPSFARLLRERAAVVSTLDDLHARTARFADQSNTTLWSSQYRLDAWPVLLDRIAPGESYICFRDPARLGQYTNDPATNNLQTIELKSIGYISTKMSRAAMPLQTSAANDLSEWFVAKADELSDVMMSTDDEMLGDIIQHISKEELDTLQFAWGLKEGWPDANAAEAVTFDGLLPGGTGRVSGVVQRMTWSQ